MLNGSCLHLCEFELWLTTKTFKPLVIMFDFFIWISQSEKTVSLSVVLGSRASTQPLSASSERVSSNSKATQTAQWPQAVNNYINVRASSSPMRAADLKKQRGWRRRSHTAEQPYPKSPFKKHSGAQLGGITLARLKDGGKEMKWRGESNKER